MTEFLRYDAADVAGLLRGRMGLIIGPDITCGEGFLDELSAHLAVKFKVSDGRDYKATSDAALQAGEGEQNVREGIREFIEIRKKPAALSTLAKGKWAAVLSLSIDNNFETELKLNREKHPLRRNVFVASSLATNIPQKTLPVFKLLGRADGDDFAFCKTEYLLRKNDWNFAIHEFADHTKGNPVLCVGIPEGSDLLHDLLGLMISRLQLFPKQLIFLSDSAIGNDSTAVRLLERARARVAVLGNGLRDLISSLDAAEAQGYHPTLPFPEDADGEFGQLALSKDLAEVVNCYLQSSISIQERTRLHEMLFSPEATGWDAYVHNLDFKRSITSTLYRQTVGHLAQKDLKEAAIVLSGSAACGKTTALKRLALEFARSGHVVLWFRNWFFNEPARTLLDFLKTLARLKFTKKKRLICVVDDPFRMGAVAPAELIGAAKSISVDVILLVGVRSSDLSTVSLDTVTGGLPCIVNETIPDELDDSEWNAIPEYLYSLGIVESVEAGQIEARNTPARSTRDTLSLLFWLLPATKSAIRSSIREEYFRLGDMSGFARVITVAEKATTELLQHAYEMAAVADAYKAQLPIEVLVSALEVDYDTWLAASSADGPAWGFLYPTVSDDGGACYRTRNDIITQVVLRAVNGGTTNRSGEIAVLLKLLKSCTGGAPAYHEFCLSILVNNEKTSTLDPAQGLELFDSAIKALPFQCKTLLHHKARWVKNKCGDPLEAQRLLDIALSARDFPYARQVELDAHLYVSKAATEIDAMDKELVSMEEGKTAVMRYLAKAKESNFFLARAVHVEANLILRLAPRLEADFSPDSAILLNSTLANIDRALLILRGESYSAARAADDASALVTMRDKLLLAVDPKGDLLERAEALWSTYNSQQGFILYGRRLFETAETTNKGSDYHKAFEYIEGVHKRVREHATADPMLSELMIHIYYRWRIQRTVYSGVSGVIDWDFLKEMCRDALRSNEIGANPFYSYILALCHAHVGEWGKSAALLGKLRDFGLPKDVLWAERDFLLDEHGKACLVQGQINPGVSGQMFFANDLKADFRADRRGHWNREGEEDFAYVCFMFGGIKAVDRHSIARREY